MKKKFFGIVVLTIVLLVAGLSACHTSAVAPSPNNPGTVGSLGSGDSWSYYDNVKLSDDNYASVSLDHGDISKYIKATNFGFSIPSDAVVNGIKVEVEKREASAADKIKDSSVKIVKSNTVAGSEKADTTNYWSHPNDTTVVYGGGTDLWGLPWTANDINSADFGVAISAVNVASNGSSRTAYVDNIKITVYYTAPVTTVLAVAPVVTTYNGGSVILSATMTPAVSGKAIAFSINGTSKGSANTNSSGVATLPNVSLSGMNAGNYTIEASFAGDSGYKASNGSATLTINKKDQTITFNSLSGKTYGDTDFDITATADSGLTVDLASNREGVCTVSGKTVHIVGVGVCSITARQSGNVNYNAATEKSQSFVVAKKTLTPVATASNKAYDGTTAATAVIVIEKVGSDDVSASGVANFSDKNVGTGKTVTVKNIVLSGTSAGNYSLTSTTTTATADITAKNLKVSATGINKVYDGTTAATVKLGSDALEGDNLSLAYASAEFVDAEAGSDKPVHVTGISIAGGADMNNYSLSNTEADTTAAITPNLAKILLDKDNLIRDYNGKPQEVGVKSTDPSGLTTVVLYNGSVTAPANAGTYNVLGSIVSSDYAGTDSAVLTINKIGQTITFDPLKDRNYGEESFTIAASSDSGLDVTFSASGVCTVSKDVVTLTGKGDCTITADQAGDGNYNAAASISQTFKVNDNTAPKIKITGSNPLNLVVGDKFEEEGAIVTDDVDTKVDVVIGGDTVDTSKIGTYKVTYDATDSSGNKADQAVRTVNVSIRPAPVLSKEEITNVTGVSAVISWLTNYPATSRVVYGVVSRETGSEAPNYGYATSTAEDVATTTTHSVLVDGLTSGVKYFFRVVSNDMVEAVGNEISTTTLDVVPPAITINGDNPAKVIIGSAYTDAGATAIDNVDTQVNVVASGTVDTSTLGSYIITYTATDTASNTASATRTVDVIAKADEHHWGQIIRSSNPAGQVLGASTFLFTHPMGLGSKLNPDVMELQIRLSQEGFFVGTTTGVFDLATKKAVQGYQKKYGIPATGYVGKLTIAKLNGNNVDPVTARIEKKRLYNALVQLEKYFLSIKKK